MKFRRILTVVTFPDYVST